MRLNAVLKLSYRKEYEQIIIQSHFDGQKLGFNAEKAATLMVKCFQNVSESVKRASFRLTDLKKIDHFLAKSETFFTCNLGLCNAEQFSCPVSAINHLENVHDNLNQSVESESENMNQSDDSESESLNLDNDEEYQMLISEAQRASNK